MTQDEAKTKACFNVTPRRVWNWKRFEFVTEFRGCIGPRCMAWRWLPKASGYCGLAGAPDWDASEVELPQ
jgi:hypothetical protein